MPVLLCLCKQEIIFFCVREEPVVFLHKDDDFVPYTPRRKENLHENLHGLEKEETGEHLELTIRSEVSITVYNRTVYEETEPLIFSDNFIFHSFRILPSSTKTSSTSTTTSSS